MNCKEFRDAIRAEASRQFLAGQETSGGFIVSPDVAEEIIKLGSMTTAEWEQWVAQEKAKELAAWLAIPWYKRAYITFGKSLRRVTYTFRLWLIARLEWEDICGEDD